jgi:peroxiredoxin (alkyl hydroperoxide reductase subunit C)
MKTSIVIVVAAGILLAFMIIPAFGASAAFKDNIYNPGQLKPIDSKLKVKIGDPAPDFTLPSVSGEKITLSQYKSKKNVMISFVPAAWTPVCSDQWPGYNIVKEINFYPYGGFGNAVVYQTGRDGQTAAR